MASKSVPDLKEFVRQAAEVAQEVPKSLQEAAFHRALDLLVGTGGGPSRVPEATVGKQHPEPQPDPQPGAGAIRLLLEQVDSTQYPSVRSATKVLDRSLMILQIASNDHAIDGLTPVEIARLLTEKFALSTTRQAVGMALKGASHLVNRVAEGRGYRYQIMGPGQEYLAHAERGSEGSAEPTKRAKKKPKSQKKVDGQKEQKTKKRLQTTSSRRRGGVARAAKSTKRPGPKAEILALIGVGYFGTPKTGPEVQDHLKKKRGFDFGMDQIRMALLRLVRDQKLERDENDQGQYEYKQA